MPLDKKRPYGIIYGHEQAKYEQDGVLYRHDGTPIQSNNTLTIKGSKHAKEERNRRD